MDTGSRTKEIYAMNDNGEDITRITHSPYHHCIVGIDRTNKLYWVKSISLTFVLFLAGCFLRDNSDFNGFKIIFESSRDVPQGATFPQKYIELYTMNPDGSNVMRITNNQYWEHKPQVSPDGTKILITIHYLPENVDETDPGWEIAVMNIDGTGLTKLTDNEYFDGNARWNEDGTKIVYVSDSNQRTSEDLENHLLPQYDIYVMNADGTNKTKLTSGEPGDVNADPCFSPDGSIFYIHSEDYSNHFDLWRMNGDGSEKMLFFSHNETIQAINDPSVSHNGERIVFEGRVGNNAERLLYNLFSLNSNGSELLRLTLNDGESDIWPSYSPDNNYIVYFTYEWDENGGHTQKIRIAKSDGSEEQEISSFPWESFPGWFEK